MHSHVNIARLFFFFLFSSSSCSHRSLFFLPLQINQFQERNQFSTIQISSQWLRLVSTTPYMISPSLIGSPNHSEDLGVSRFEHFRDPQPIGFPPFPSTSTAVTSGVFGVICLATLLSFACAVLSVSRKCRECFHPSSGTSTHCSHRERSLT